MHYWTTEGIVTRIKYEHLVSIWSLYRKVGISFRELFVYTGCLFIQGAYKLSEDFAKPYFHKY
jgi:hypothetical protein